MTTTSSTSSTSTTASPSATPVATPTPTPTPTPAPAPAPAPTPSAPPPLVPPGLCIFPYSTDAHGLIQYPDAIGNFAQTDLTTSPGNIIARYSGALTTLTAYAYPTAAAPTPAPSWDITRKAFMLRFTSAELVAIYTAAGTTPAVQADLAVFNNSSYINLQDPTTVALLGNLVAANLITAARQTAILSQPAQPGEQYTGPL